MPEFIIGGVPVSFPFEPYDVQRRYMEKVIESLDKSANSVLESPTGWLPLQEKNISNLQLIDCRNLNIRYGKNAQFAVFNTGMGFGEETTGASKHG